MTTDASDLDARIRSSINYVLALRERLQAAKTQAARFRWERRVERAEADLNALYREHEQQEAR